MSKSHHIFGKRRRLLTPGQLRSVAQYRYDDALCLRDNKRATGAMYMGGFVIECLLKALLLERHANLQVPVDPAKLSSSDRDVYELLYSHELDEMLGFLPEVQKKLNVLKDAAGRPVWERFRSLCEEWTVYARYSPKLAKVEEAKQFLHTIKEVKEWLKGL